LAETLARRAPGQTIDPASVAQEAGGHPLFIGELVRHAVAEGAQASGVVPLEDMLWARIGHLAPEARQVLELTALGSGRMIQRTLATAAGLSFGDFAKQVARLRAEHLLATSGVHDSDSVE